MRDVVIDEIYEAALEDRNIMFLSADLGAKSLDRFRRDIPDQFVHVGISEQNMIDVAAGLALSGKKVFVYAMAPFITARCYEQIKSLLAAMQLPVTIVGVGVGLGYDHATLTHFSPDDIACMRALNGIEILTPSDAHSAQAIAQLVISEPKFSYIRLDRQAQNNLYEDDAAAVVRRGFGHLVEGSDVALVACGALVHKALEAARELSCEGFTRPGVIDLLRVKPVPEIELNEVLKRYRSIVTVDEQLLDGGLGSAVVELLADFGELKSFRRLGIQDRFDVVNGDRNELHEMYGIDVPAIVEAARAH